MLLVAHLPQREAVTPEVAAAGVLRVEVLGVDAVDAVQRLREAVAQALDDEVVVVRHQAESVDVQAEPLDRLPELGEEATAVVAVEVDLSPFDAARRRVPDAVVGKRRAGQPGHAPKLEPEVPRSKPCGNIGTKDLRRGPVSRDPSGDSPRTGALRSRPFGAGSVRSRTRPHSWLASGIVVDTLTDDAGAVALVQPVRVGEPLVRPDLELDVAAAARLRDDRREESRPGAASARLRQHVEPLQRSMARETRCPHDAPVFSATKNAAYDSSTSRRSA